METMTFRIEDLITQIPITVHITGHKLFFFRNRIALRVLWAGAWLASLVGKNLNIEIKA